MVIVEVGGTLVEGRLLGYKRKCFAISNEVESGYVLVVAGDTPGLDVIKPGAS